MLPRKATSAVNVRVRLSNATANPRQQNATTPTTVPRTKSNFHLDILFLRIPVFYYERDLMLPDGKPAPPPGFRVRRFWTEAEPHDSAPLNGALPHADLRHACVLSPIIPTVVSHTIVPLPSLFYLFAFSSPDTPIP